MVRFFSYIHRSILDPSLYRELPAIGGRRIGFYILKLVLLTAMISGIANTYYLFHNKRGIVTPLAAAFSGMEIKNGRLFPNRPLPYEPTPEEVSAIMSRFYGTSFIARNTVFPALVIDTSSGTKAAVERPTIIMGRSDITLRLPAGLIRTLPYSELLAGRPGLQFTESEIKKIILANSVSIFTAYCLLNGGFCAATAFFCICILALAAYIFRFDRQKPIGYFFKVAGFAVTPIPLGVILIALSDVKIAGAWDMLVIVSFAVMFRALLSMMKADRAANAGEGKV